VKDELSGINQKRLILSIFLMLFTLYIYGCVTYKPSTLVISRGGTLLDDGKLYVYVDGKVINEQQPIGKGQSRSLPVANGFHRIRVSVNSLESDEMQFSVENNSARFSVSTERVGGSKVLILERSTE
jgi:hypothetical protein